MAWAAQPRVAADSLALAAERDIVSRPYLTVKFVAVLLVVVALVAGYIWWRWTSVRRGANQRDEIIAREVDPIANRLEHGEFVAPADVGALASRPQLRPLLYMALKHYKRTDLFPTELLSPEAQAEGILAYWLMHPNELQAPPSELAHVAALQRPFQGRPAQWYVLRYRMPAGHWAEKHGWQLGLAGPFFPGEEPYLGAAGGFSRAGDAYGKVTPDELVTWYVGILEKKRGGG